MRIQRSADETFQRFTQELQNRRQRVFQKLGADVQSLLEDYRARGEESLVEMAQKFDGISLTKDELFVDPDHIRNAHKVVSAEIRQAIEHTIARIERFQAELKPSGFQAQEEAGVYWGVELRPLERVGVYVPRGYINALLLSAVPARIAKVDELVLATPPDAALGAPYVDPILLYICKIFEIEKIIVSGGVGALAALAYGTSGTPPVEKIVGPTGQLGMVAKQFLSSDCAIDGTTGPVEVVFLCNSSSQIKSVAADVFGLSERNPNASIFVCHHEEAWLRKLVEELIFQLQNSKESKGREGSRWCLENNTHFIQFPSVVDSAAWINLWAPGLVVLPVDEAAEYVPMLKRCGGVLLGRYSSPVSLDIYGGAIGLVPTLGSAASMTMSSPAAFLRRFSLVEVQKDAVARLKAESLALAQAEGFMTHQGAFKTRDQ